MTFSGAVQKPPLDGVALRKGTLDWAMSAIPAALVGLFVSLPWLASGYIFGTDWPGPRRFDFPGQLSSSAPFQLALAALSRVVGAEATGKGVVFAVLMGGAWTAFRAAPVDGFVGRLGTAAVFTLNPFVFGRVHYGQLYLLAGYAALPWAASRLRSLCAEPGWRAGLLFGISVSLIAIFSLHLFLVASFLSAIVVLAYVVFAREKSRYTSRLAL